MSTLNLASLAAKLNQTCRYTLEKATGLCVAQTHSSVEIEHWLTSLLEQPQSSFSVICRHYEVDRGLLQKELQQTLTQLQRGHERTPALAIQLIELLQKTWSIASLQYNDSHINSGYLLLTLLTDPLLQQSVKLHLPQLNKISLTDLPMQLQPLISSSAEGKTIENTLSTTTDNTSALAQYTHDLTEQAKAGKLDPVLGRENEIRQLIDILIRRRQNNPMLVGEAGVGKTAVVEGFALRIAAGDVPGSLQNVAVKVLDLALLQAGAGVKGEFENRLKNVISEVKASAKPIILFIDEAHTLIGAGGQAGQGDAANLLKPALARGELRTIAATTWAEYKKHIEKDAALTRRFQTVKINEPSEEVAQAMLRGLVPALEKHHQVRILEEAVIAAVQLAKRYLPERQLPDKSVSLLDTACAQVRLNQTAIPAAIQDITCQLQQIENEMVLLNREAVKGADHRKKLKQLDDKSQSLSAQQNALNVQWQAEQSLIAEIQRLHKTLEQAPNDEQPKLALKQVKKLESRLAKIQGEHGLMQPCINAETIAKVIAGWTGIPVGKMLQDEIKAVQQLTNELNTRIIGQTQAIQAISEQVQAARAGLTDPNKPSGVFLLLGSSGIGKTETALALADLLYGGEQALTIINMSEFKEEHKVSLLTGSPPGYIGYGEGGVLTEAVRRRPYGVILLDEMEKAHPGVQDIFYQVFDKGMLMDGEGRWVDFKNTLILMTSNVCSEQMLNLNQQPLASSQVLASLLRPELLKVFKSAFLGRVTIVPYLPLQHKALVQIVELKLAKIAARITKHYGAIVNYPLELINHMARQCHEQESGARNIDALFNASLLPMLSNELLAAMAKRKQVKEINLNLQTNDLTVQLIG